MTEGERRIPAGNRYAKSPLGERGRALSFRYAAFPYRDMQDDDVIGICDVRIDIVGLLGKILHFVQDDKQFDIIELLGAGGLPSTPTMIVNAF